MLQVFSINVYALLSPGATLSIVTPLIAKKFLILPDILNETFMVTNPEGESVVSKRVYQNCLIMFLNSVTLVELLELYIVNFDVILGMIGCMIVFLPLTVELQLSSLIYKMNPF